MGNICFCGKEKAEDRLACPRCFDTYRKETKGKANLIDWVQSRCLERLEELGVSQKGAKTNLEQELEEKNRELRQLERQLSEEVNITLQERIAGAGKLRQDELQELKEDIRKELWKERGGNRLYAQVKALQEEIEQKVAPIRQVLEQVGKTKKEQSSVDRLISSILPKDKT